MSEELFMSRYLDPKADIVFKKIFGDHPHLLKSFLNAVLPLEDNGLIETLIYLPPEHVPEIPVMKRTIVDVKCTDKQGRVFIVEMQIEWDVYFKERLLFTSSQAYVRQLEKGEQYHLLQPVYGLGLIAATFDPNPEHWYHHYQLVNVEKPRREVIDGLQLILIELPKFQASTHEEKQLRTLWLRFMREINEHTRRAPEELLAVPEISEALELAEEAAFSPGEMDAYDSYWKAVSSEKTLMYGRYLKGKNETIRKFHQSGASLDMIQQASGLTLKEIEKILAEEPID
jgi:predicted transposase/invertase (TIGR01784 family)